MLDDWLAEQTGGSRARRAVAMFYEAAGSIRPVGLPTSSISLAAWPCALCPAPARATSPPRRGSFPTTRRGEGQDDRTVCRITYRYIERIAGGKVGRDQLLMHECARRRLAAGLRQL